jgi:peptidoglycan/xylan/chitin deacetylase (PgdA/CDA1 family)
VEDGRVTGAVLLFHDVYRRDPSESGFSGRGADRYKLSLPAFEAQLAALARVRADAPWLDETAAPTRAFALTLDDGGISFYTLVAERLEALGWRARCFVTTGEIGRAAFMSAPQIRELRGRGHAFGSHSVSHPPRFSACGAAQALREWRDSRAALADVLGEDVTTASVPGGYFAPAVARAAAEAGLTTLFTSEPRVHPRPVAGCTVVGRFTVRARHAPDFAARVAAFEPWTLASEWAAWTGKKAAKAVLGPLYLRLAA